MTEVDVSGPAGMQEAGIFMSTTSTAARSPTLRTNHTFEDYSSQSSSLSQRSGPAPLKLSTSDVSRSTFPAPATEDVTPPSSTASPHREHEHGQGKIVAQTSEPVTVGSKPQSTRGSQSPSASGSQSDGTTSTKRTASGQIKISPHAAGTGDAIKTETRHERASSSVSAVSTTNVTEISQQLRTRLKYAMIKVQNGWQTRSLEELESLASASPRSHTSPFLHGSERASHFTPRAVAGAKMDRKWSDSSSSEDSRSEPRMAALASSNAAGASSNRMDGRPVRTLAPPVDIVPGARRRPTPNDTGLHPPPGRSHHHRPTSQRTPSQNAAMEADAVETLLFMASPNNSGYHPPSQASQESSLRSTLQFSAQTSPLRAQFSQASMTSPKKVAFSDQERPSLPASKSELIDNMINNVPDESDSELDAVLNLADQRRDAKLPT